MNFFGFPVRPRSIAFLFAIVLASCGSRCQHGEEPGSSKTVHLFVWGEYTSKALFDRFTAQTGIEVVESNFSSNEELLAKLQTGVDGYDLIIPSDYMVQVMAELGLLRQIDHGKIPNIANIDPELLNLRFDQGNRWSLPYSYAVTGITYNKERVKSPPMTYLDLWTNNELRLRFSVLDDSREVFASALKQSGFSANSNDTNELRLARDLLISAKANIREFTSTPAAMLESGDLLAAQMYSNESLRLIARDPRFAFILPDSGFSVSMDNFAVPKSARNPDNAHALINFLLNPSINLEFATEIMTAPVTKGTRSLLPEPIRSHQAIQPISALLKKGEMLRDVGGKIQDYDRMWTELKIAGY